MKKLIGTAAVAVVCGVMAGHAQESTTRTTTTTKGGSEKTITYTGCVGSNETRSYTLNHILPTGQTTTTEAPGANGEGSVTTTTTYTLVPGPKVEFQEFVGHKVEVTGVMIPGGDSETKTTTKTDNDHGPDSKKVERVKTENGRRQFRVLSIKQLGESCQ